MSEIVLLKEALAEYRKANKELDEKLNKAAENLAKQRQESTEQQSRQS